MQRDDTLYTLVFAALVCGVCSILVSGFAVGLKSRQEMNQVLDRQLNVLRVAGVVGAGEKLRPGEIQERYAAQVEPRIVTLETGEYDSEIDPKTFNLRRAAADPATSKKAPENPAQVARIPVHSIVFLIKSGETVDQIVLPVEGKGLWSTLYGYLALDKDTNTIRGLTFYEHGETPGLGGEIDNPRWKALWPGRKAFDDLWKPAIKVIKGAAGPPDQAPHEVDGLSGATFTSRGVQYLIEFWLGDNGFGPYLKRFREQGS